MAHDLVIEGKVVNHDTITEVQVGIDRGFITEIKKQGLQGEQVIKAQRSLIFPGFIDLHAHLREDESQSWSYKEDFQSGAWAALHGGITTVVDMPNTPLPGINAARIRRKKALADSKSNGLIDFLFYGAVTASNATINTSGILDMQREVVAYKMYLSKTGELFMPVALLPEALKTVEGTSKPLVIHCEDQGIIEARQEALKAGGTHSELRPEEAELSAVKHVLAAASALHGIKINIAHVSVYETLAIIKRYEHIHCEVTPHHLFFNEDEVTLKTAFLKTNPPLRTEQNRRRLLDAFRAGAIDFMATDHAPHTQEEKELDFLEAPAGVPNLDTFGSFVTWLIVDCNVHPVLISRICAYNPAIFLGLNDRGRIEVGKKANITILDVHNREKIRCLYTKCGWSPFDSFEFPGTVRHTIFNGVVMTDYDDLVFV
ncbi:MAG: dihydroorotase [Halobacteriota archaeon]